MKKILVGVLFALAAGLSQAPDVEAVKLFIKTSAAPPTCGNIVPSLVLARNTGVAPLFVMADASGTTDTTVPKPFHDATYTYDYGDPGAGTWAAGARPGTNSKNASWGPMGGHVFETAGSYTITLTIYDGTNTCQTTAGVTVSDPDTVFSGTNTTCVSTSGNFTGCPAGANQVTSSDFRATLAANVTSGKRTLYRKTESFTASSNVIVTATGPGLVGAYGTGAAPIVTMTGSVGSQPILRFGNTTTVNQKDWRVMDLSFVGNGNAEALGLGGGFDQLTFLRIKARSCNDACIFFNSAVLNVAASPHLFDQAAVIDSDLAEPQSWALYFNAKNFMIAGNTLDSATGSHTLRISIGIWGQITNNTLGPNGVGTAGNHVLKLHAPPFGSATDGVPAGTRSEKVVIGYNKLTPGNNTTNNWTMAIDPQDSAEDERLANIIIEGNAFTAGTNTVEAIEIQAVDASIRNNVMNGTGGACGCFLEVAQRSSAAPQPSGIIVSNNSMYTNSNNLNASDTPFIQIDSTTATGGVVAKNNLGYAPGVAGTPLMFRDQGSGNTKTNNSSDAQTKINPNLTTNPPLVIGDYKITVGSYAIGTGTSVTNWYDAVRIGWQPTWDIGAVKH